MSRKPKLPLPPDRTLEQLVNHFEVERAIAARLLKADRAERASIYRTMYDELFAKVPDHPRLTRREDPERTAALNRSRLSLLGRFIRDSDTVLEFGPGDCRFAYELCDRVANVIGVDISDQRGPDATAPNNFRHVVYDGYNLTIEKKSVDVVLSDQLIEHLHPEDTSLHFQTVREVLRDGGVYVLRTPHRASGPHDVSKYFCDEPGGFHLKEWTYGELAGVLRASGFRSWHSYRAIRSRPLRLPIGCFALLEWLLRAFSTRARRSLARYLVPEILIVAKR